MAAAKDIALTQVGGDLLIKNGDFNIWLSDESHIYDIVVDNQGDWKNNINLCLGIEKYSESSGQENIIAQNLKIMLQSDGYTVSKPLVSYNASTGQLNLNPNAERT